MSFFKKIFKSKSDSESAAAPAVDDGPPPKGIVMTTSMGDITIKLYPDQAPKVSFLAKISHFSMNNTISLRRARISLSFAIQANMTIVLFIALLKVS